MYLVKASWLLRRLHPPAFVWRLPATAEQSVYFTFDDGPHPEATTFVLETLAAYSAKGTFFCIGKNVDSYPDIYRQLLADGHRTGNHTCHHLNGWKTPLATYLEDTAAAASLIDSNLFRPPYGRISKTQAAGLMAVGYRIIMWDILSGDFDLQLSPEACLRNVCRYMRPGAIIVFHDSSKAWERLRYALPRALDYCYKQGWHAAALPDL